MKYTLLKERIKKNEGFSNKAYKDCLKKNTIGYGHLIRSNEKFFLKKKFSKKFLTSLFERDFNTALLNYQNNFKNLSFSKNVQELLIEMIFQMGVNNTLSFRKAILYIKKKNKYLASLELMRSLWYKQTPKRVENLIKNYLNQ